MSEKSEGEWCEGGNECQEELGGGVYGENIILHLMPLLIATY